MWVFNSSAVTSFSTFFSFLSLNRYYYGLEESKELETPLTIQDTIANAIIKEKGKHSLSNNYRSWMQIAASIAFLTVGFVFGKLSAPDQSENMASLQEEIKLLKEITLTSALQNHSASERILAVNQIEGQNEINEELIQTLVITLNSDESTNVRYSALQALRKFVNAPKVKAELVKSLESQTDPLIQISLIQILVESEEKSAIAPLKDIIKNDKITPEVKLQAEVALKVLT